MAEQFLNVVLVIKIVVVAKVGHLLRHPPSCVREIAPPACLDEQLLNCVFVIKRVVEVKPHSIPNAPPKGC